MFGHGHHHHHHGQHQQPPPQQEQTTFKILCRADEGYCLTVRQNAVVLAPTDPRDHCQHWFKDMRFSTKVKDAEGHPAFALVNRATGLAIKHSLGQSHPVQLVPYNYNLDYEDESVLWTESKDVGKGFRCIRMVNNTRLGFDAFHGDKRHGGVHDGTAVVLWEWCKGDNQSWKILPWGDEAYYAPPQPAYGAGGYAYPPYPAGGSQQPPPGGHHQQEPGYGGYRPPAPGGPPGGYAPPPAQAQDAGYGGGYRPPIAPGYSNLPRALASECTVRVYCKADDGYSLTVRNGAVCLAPTNPRDDFQHWVKDVRHSTSIRDEEGYPAFALVNKVTGEAIKHSLGQSHPVRLVPYNPDYVDESVMWTESRDVGHGFRCIRMVNNIYLNFDAFHGDKDHGGVHDGTTVVLWEWAKGDNQRWKIVPWCKSTTSAAQHTHSWISPMIIFTSFISAAYSCLIQIASSDTSFTSHFANRVLRHIWHWFHFAGTPITTTANIRSAADWLSANTKGTSEKERRRNAGILIYFWWNVWKERNRRFFQVESKNEFQVAVAAKEEIDLYLLASRDAFQQEDQPLASSEVSS